MTAAELVSMTPVLILALGATAILMAGAWFPERRRPLILASVALGFLSAFSAIVLTPSVTEAGGLFGTGPYGRFFTVVWSLAAALTLLPSLRRAERAPFAAGEYASLVLFAAAGMSLLSSAVSLVGLFLGLETFTLAFYILIAFDKSGPQGAEAGLKYLVLGATATGFLAFGIALAYASSGTFHLPEALTAPHLETPLRPVDLIGWGMLLAALAFKISLAPFHLWTPDVYEGAPTPVTGFLAAGSKGAVLALLMNILPPAAWELTGLLWIFAAVTMIAGTLCALRQQNVKRLLAYSSVVHMGTVAVGLVAGGAGRSAVLFYIVAYATVTLGAFGVLASFSDDDGDLQEIASLRGLALSHPWRSGALALFLLSLAGIPPTAGFMAKFGIFAAALRGGYTGLAFIGIFTALVSVAYYLRVVIVLFMTEEQPKEMPESHFADMLVLAACIAATIGFGLYPDPLFRIILTISG